VSLGLRLRFSFGPVLSDVGAKVVGSRPSVALVAPLKESVVERLSKQRFTIHIALGRSILGWRNRFWVGTPIGVLISV
jgi:hypothetical protein